MGRAVATRARGTVLVVEDDEHVRFGMVAALRVAGHTVVEASTCAEAAVRFRTEAPNVAVVDLRLPDGNAMDLLPRLRAIDPSVPIFIVTGYGTIDLAVSAVKQGAEDFFTKPLDMPRLVGLVHAATEQHLLRRSSRVRRYEGPPHSTSPQMREVEAQAERLRDADCSVLILGETGTGKSLLARRIHEIGARSSAPFVDVNCASLSREFVESELFGHERGAFTGAHAPKTGLFDAAHLGTLFLDEIGDIDPQVQPKILKVLEQKRFRRMGDVREREVDVRLVAATHHDLLGLVSERRFRADLYYRISTVTLTMPALRERPDDILPLAREILRRRAGEEIELSGDAGEKLLGYYWPGNIRELKNVVERALLLRPGAAIVASDISFDSPTSARAPGVRETPISTSRLRVAEPATATMNEIEREHIQLALTAENGRVEAAAKRLGIPRSTMYQRLKTYGIAVPRARTRDDKRRENDSEG